MADQVIVPRRREDFFNDRGEPTLRFIRFLETLTTTTNDSTTIINENQEQIDANTVNIGVNAGNISTNTTNIATNADDIESLEYRVFDIVDVVADVTLEEYKIAICRNTTPITVTLKLLPVLGDEIQIKRTDAEVTVIGLIDGLSDQIINVVNWSSHYVYNGTDWSSI